MRNWLWTWALIFNVTGMLSACHDDKPVIKPDPDFANCEAAKDQRENGCLIDAATRAEFDDCIARVRKSCVDGGAK